jgi:DNA processing protein
MDARSLETRTPTGLLTLLGLHGVGPQTADRLSKQFQTIGEVQDHAQNQGASKPALKDANAWTLAFSRAGKIVERADREGVKIVTVADAAYPEWLALLPDRPLVLYVKGSLPQTRRCIACIGTREPSRFGEEVTKRLVTLFAGAGWSIISGLAIGVDALSHRAALQCKAHTVAILANGLDTVYPKANAALAEEILDANGALVSEQPFGTPAIPRNLVQRDRLQSGMSAGTVVMQTDIKGGSMHTVRFTLLQRRLLLAPVPTGIHATEDKSRGILALTQQTGTEFAGSIGATGEYAQLLRQSFDSRPVARPITSRDDYVQLISELDNAADALSPETSHPAKQMQTDMFSQVPKGDVS